MKKRRLITSALPYVNNVPHLGNIIGCVLSADVFARYSRLAGYQVRFVCGTDEHGTATEAKALQEGLSPKEICDKYHAIHKHIYEWFGCSFDVFGRTSVKKHVEMTQDIFLKLDANGYISRGDVEQLWCPKCDKFLADRFVEGTCPKCGYERARGDQCDGCGNLLNAVDLISPVCKTCDSHPQPRTANHLFLDLPRLSPLLEVWAKKTMDPGFWTQNAKTVTKAWFTDGLKERAISRDLKWGVPIPLEEYKDKVFYVWFDATIGYISITANAFDDWEKWWKSSDVELYQFMAKDNIPFHTIIFPASLLGTGEPWTMLHHIDSTEYLNYESGKFSKSNNVGVFGDDAVSTGIPPDVWRYYLLVNRPESADTQFSWKDFQDKNNNELLANLGNFVNRTLTFIDRYFDGMIPDCDYSELDKKFMSEVDVEFSKVCAFLDSVRLKDALRQVMHISRLGNQYFQENAPWKLINDDRVRCSAVMRICANLVRNLAVLINPFLPFTSGDVMHQLNAYKDGESYSFSLSWDLKGHAINKPKPLFGRLDDAFISSLREKFGGARKDTSKKSVKQEKRRAALESFDLFPLHLKVGQVVQVSDHPDAERLFVLRVDLVEEKRQIVAGLRPYLSRQDILDRKIVVVTNLKPANLRGVESQGMLLAGDGKVDGKEKVLLVDPGNSPVGSDVYLESVETAKSDSLLDFDEFTKLSFSIRDGQVFCDNVRKRLRTEDDFVSCPLPDDSTVR